jgi:hypothetical protein
MNQPTGIAAAQAVKSLDNGIIFQAENTSEMMGVFFSKNNLIPDIPLSQKHAINTFSMVRQYILQ